VSDVEAGESGQRVGERIASETEAAIYDHLDLEWIPPELREDTGEVEAAAEDALPELVTETDVVGDLQMHTEYSDGSASVEEMARAAADRGHEYIAITDHGPGAPIPSRLTREDFDNQQEAIAAVNGDEAIETTVLHGIEAEITDDGLGISREWAADCDLVVAALHDRPDDATERIVHVLDTYPVDILAHPTNRLINQRDPIDLDIEAVVQAAADNGVAIEINAQPGRLDLHWQAVKQHREEVSFVVSTDAHTTGELDNMHLGVSQARRGWCEADNVVNTKPQSEFLTWLT
jgi:DNA polymerase (family 10)